MHIRLVSFSLINVVVMYLRNNAGSMIEQASNWPLLRFNNAEATTMPQFDGRPANPRFSYVDSFPGKPTPDTASKGSSGKRDHALLQNLVNRISASPTPLRTNEQHLRVMLNIIVCPIVITVGTIGNLISFLTLIRPRLRHQTTAIYLAVLAINDLGAIWFGLLRHYLLYGYGVEVRSSDATCKAHILLTYWFMHNSSVLLAAVGVQRYMFVCHNTRFRSYMTNKSTFMIIGTLIVAVLLCEIHYPIFYTMTLHPVKKIVGCTVDKNKYATYYQLRENFIGYMQLIAFYILPFVILLVSNVLIIRNLVISTRKMKGQKKSGIKRRNVSVMMIAISFYFTVLTTPAQIYIGFAQFVEQRPSFLLEWTIITLVYYTNHASNFVLYFLTGNLFREEMYSMFKETFVKMSTVFLEPCLPSVHTRIQQRLFKSDVNRRRSSMRTTTAAAATIVDPTNHHHPFQRTKSQAV